MSIPNLDGAAPVPPLHTEAANAAEFAGIWNAATPSDREAMFLRMREWRDTATRCFTEDHTTRLDQARADQEHRAQRARAFILLARDLDDAKTHDMRGCRTVVTLAGRTKARGIRADEIRVTAAALDAPPTALITLLDELLPNIETATKPAIRILTAGTLHQAPVARGATMPCCNTIPIELSLADRLTRIAALVTCGPTPNAYALAEGA